MYTNLNRATYSRRSGMTPFDTYKQYLAYKNHFTRDKYDYFRYAGKSKAKLESFYKRKDRYFFEKTSRKYKDQEIKDFFLANFTSTDNPQGIWIGEIIGSGDKIYKSWEKRQQSLFYIFKNNIELIEDIDLFLDASKGHSPLLKFHLAGKISVEEMVIYEKIFGYCKNYDKQLNDPVWKIIGLKIKKYSPFVDIDIRKYKKYLIENV